jgi:hypothetical protein
MKFAQGLGLALAFLHDVKSQIFIKSRIYLQPRLINGAKRLINEAKILILIKSKIFPQTISLFLNYELR